MLNIVQEDYSINYIKVTGKQFANSYWYKNDFQKTTIKTNKYDEKHCNSFSYLFKISAWKNSEFLNLCSKKMAVQGTDQVHGYKDCPNCLIPALTMVVAKKIYDFQNF